MLIVIAAQAHGTEIETNHLFSFNIGTDINDLGEEAELDSGASVKRKSGSYAAYQSDFVMPIHAGSKFYG
ncbi:MAG TPA: hypothetical protein VFA57_11540 [Pseudolabrys sp.]|nr:hypothetical protein [Pseudolabrys sp.]